MRPPDIKSALNQQNPIIWRGLLVNNDKEMIAQELTGGSALNTGLENRAVAVFNGTHLSYPNTRDEFQRLWEQQRGHIIQDVDTSTLAISGVKHAIERQSLTRLTVAAYISEAAHSVLPMHSDTRPVLALQVKGKKKFDLVSDDNQSTEVVLQSGDGLYIPPGLRHRTTTIVDSMHLCVEFHET